MLFPGFATVDVPPIVLQPVPVIAEDIPPKTLLPVLVVADDIVAKMLLPVVKAGEVPPKMLLPVLAFANDVALDVLLPVPAKADGAPKSMLVELPKMVSLFLASVDSKPEVADVGELDDGTVDDPNLKIGAAVEGIVAEVVVTEVAPLLEVAKDVVELLNKF